MADTRRTIMEPFKNHNGRNKRIPNSNESLVNKKKEIPVFCRRWMPNHILK